MHGATTTNVEGQITTVNGGGQVSVTSGGLTQVDGGVVMIKPSGCVPAARMGDQIIGTGLGAVVGSITTGSATVCIGS